MEKDEGRCCCGRTVLCLEQICIETNMFCSSFISGDSVKLHRFCWTYVFIVECDSLVQSFLLVRDAQKR